MIAKPQEIVGKWFSNVAGIPEDYHFIISSNFSAKDFPSGHFITHHIKVKPKKVLLGTSGWSNFNMWREPIRDLITLTKLRHKTIKGIFRKQGMIEY